MNNAFLKIDFGEFNKDNLRATERYLLNEVLNSKVPDDNDPDKLGYMQFAYALVAHYIDKHNDKAVIKFWHELYKSVIKSENKLHYSIYKGHILVQRALASLISEANLDKFINLLKEANEQDKVFYTNSTYRPAYKILSFFQPLLLFRNELWPSNLSLRKKIANRIFIISYLNKSEMGVVWSPGYYQNYIDSCIQNDKRLKELLRQGADEVDLMSNIPDRNKNGGLSIFRKSIIFLIAHITEGILLNIAEQYRMSHSGKPMLSRFQNMLRKFYKKEKEIDFSKQSISGLSRYLCKSGVINDQTEYWCRFVQRYRDYIHPFRLRTHEYRLDSNFEKMFLMLFNLLLGDLQNS